MPTFTLLVGVQTSVEEARQAKLTGTASVSDDHLVMPGYLSVGVKTAVSSAPLCVLGTDGSLVGLDVDIAALLASEMGLRVRYVPVGDASVVGRVCDIVMDEHPGDTDGVSVVGMYTESASSLFQHGETSVLSVVDLGGKRIAVQEDSASEELLESTTLKISKRTFAGADALREAFDALAAGSVDFVLCEAYPGGYLANLHTGISFAGSFEAPQVAGIGVARDNDELAQAIQQAFDAVSSDGRLQIPRDHWVGTLPTLTNDTTIANLPKAEKKEGEAAEGDGLAEDLAITNI
jgi:polar amino acid transport system substrate-binding protein